MTKTLENASMNERFAHLFKLMSSSRFLNCEGLNKEVPFFICPYQPHEEKEISDIQEQLVSQLKLVNIVALHLNLYDIIVEILQREGDWNWIIENEESEPKSVLLEELQGVLDTEKVLVPEIASRISDAGSYDLLILSGVGQVFPYVRSHNILNNLQTVIEQKPMVMFFPGEYKHSLEEGASLELFGLLRDDKYYRAFNVYEIEN